MQRFVLIPCFLFLSLLLTASNTQIHVIQDTRFGSIDWTSMTLYASGEHPYTPHQAGAATKQVQAESMAKQQAIENLFALLMNITVDSENTLHTVLQRDRAMKTRVQSWFSGNVETHTPPRTRDGVYRIDMKLDMAKPGGILTQLDQLYPMYQLMPKTAITNVVYPYTGLVIDARHLDTFIPSTGTKVFLEDGRLMYSPSFLRKPHYARSGHILFLASPDAARIEQRAGNDYLLIKAKATLPELNDDDPPAIPVFQTDLEIFSNDAARVLPSTALRNNLANGRVVVLCTF